MKSPDLKEARKADKALTVKRICLNVVRTFRQHDGASFIFFFYGSKGISSPRSLGGG